MPQLVNPVLSGSRHVCTLLFAAGFPSLVYKAFAQIRLMKCCNRGRLEPERENNSYASQHKLGRFTEPIGQLAVTACNRSNVCLSRSGAQHSALRRLRNKFLQVADNVMSIGSYAGTHKIREEIHR